MGIQFYAPSDHTLKTRRNLLFVGALCFIHFAVQSLSDVMVMNVRLPTDFLNWSLPLCLAWFAFNYFYYLFAEFTQWKAEHMVTLRSEPTEFGPSGTFDTKTFVAEIAAFSNSAISVELGFRGGVNRSDTASLPAEDAVPEPLKAWLNTMEGRIQHSLKVDLNRIAEFQRALKKYTWANRIRFYLLDLFVPILLTLVGPIVAAVKTGIFHG